jgi:Zn-dependent metalloprotease
LYVKPLKSGLALGALGAVLATGAVTAPMASAATAAAPGPSVRPAIAAAQARAGDAARDLRLDSREQLKVKDVVTDRDGSTHVRYERTFAGLRVIGGDFVVHRTTSGAVRGVSWNASGKAEVASITPRLAGATARVAGSRTSPLAKKAADGELVVYAGGARPRLAYDVLVTGVKADQTPTRLHTIVDATSGATLARWDDIKEGSGKGIFVGNVTVGSTLSGGSYLLKDSVGNYTTDLKQATSGTGTQFTDADDVWGNGTVSDRASAAVDAQYGAEKTFDYYKNVQGRNGIKNDGVGARSRVHYGNNYENAFWDGTQMTYGDGASNTHPLVELDVAAHEMSHGVTENTAGLAYTGDAGGLNEATSDIFGTAVEFYAANSSDPGDYLIGEEVDLNGNGTPLRYMDQPSRDGASKDCWSSSLGSLDPHYSSGPLNHWFYLASEGSGAKTINGTSYNSPTCNGSTVTGITRDKAAKIWYRTLSTYLTSSSNYAAARNGAIKSAKDLYGASSAECTGVAAAFSAIAVPAGTETCSGGTTPPPTGSNLLANPGFESGAVSWAGTAGPITNNTGRPARTGSWKAWLGGNGTTSAENISQSVTIPSTAAAPTLSFWLRTDTAESGSTAYDTLKVQVVSGTTTTTLGTYSNVGANATYAQKSFSLASYKGKTVSVKLLMNEDSSLQTSFVVDDTSVTTG